MKMGRRKLTADEKRFTLEQRLIKREFKRLSELNPVENLEKLIINKPTA